MRPGLPITGSDLCRVNLIGWHGSPREADCWAWNTEQHSAMPFNLIHLASALLMPTDSKPCQAAPGNMWREDHHRGGSGENTPLFCPLSFRTETLHQYDIFCLFVFYFHENPVLWHQISYTVCSGRLTVFTVYKELILRSTKPREETFTLSDTFHFSRGLFPSYHSNLITTTLSFTKKWYNFSLLTLSFNGQETS